MVPGPCTVMGTRAKASQLVKAGVEQGEGGPNGGVSGQAPVPGLFWSWLARRVAFDGGPASHDRRTYFEHPQESGRPLDCATRADLGHRLGADLGGVRIHYDGRAATSARSVGTRAYSVGQDVYFAAGQYRPGTLEGDRLIAHEVVHTVQQRGASVGGDPIRWSGEGDPAEVEADRVSTAALAGERPQRVQSTAKVTLSKAPPAPTAKQTPKERALDEHLKEQDRVYQMIADGLKFVPDPSRGTFDNDTLFHNSCEFIAGLKFRTVLLTHIHDHTTRKTGKISYFDSTVAWPQKGGDYPEASTVTEDPRLFSAAANLAGGYSQGELKLLGPEGMTNEVVRSTIIHEVQHAADRTESPSTVNTDHPIKPFYRLLGKQAYNQYQAEFRSYWIEAEEGSTGDVFGSSSAPAVNTRTLAAPMPAGAKTATAPIQTNFKNSRQEKIFWHVVDKEDPLLAVEYARDPEFKKMADAFSFPLGGNLINSVRIHDLADAIDACHPSLNPADAKVKAMLVKADALDPIDRAFLIDPHSQPFWTHAKGALSPQVQSILLKKISPRAVGDFPPDPSMPRKDEVVV